MNSWENVGRCRFPPGSSDRFLGIAEHRDTSVCDTIYGAGAKPATALQAWLTSMLKYTLNRVCKPHWQANPAARVPESACKCMPVRSEKQGHCAVRHQIGSHLGWSRLLHPKNDGRMMWDSSNIPANPKTGGRWGRGAAQQCIVAFMHACMNA